MQDLVKTAYGVMVNEDEAMSPKLRQLVLAGLIKEKKDLPYFKSAMKKVKGGAMTTVQERQVLISVLTQFLDMIDEAPEFFNLMRRELAKTKKEEVDLEEKTDHDKDGDVDSDDWKIARDKAIKKRMQMKKEDYANAKIKKDEGHKGDKKGGDKMQHLKKLKEDPEVEKAHEEALIENALRDKANKNYGFSSFKEFRNRKFDEAYGDYDDDRAMAAQKAQMPASLGGKHKDKSRPVSSTQVTKQKSQFHSKEEVETTDEAMLDPSKSKAARLFRQGQKQHDPERQEKASELRIQRRKARGDSVWTSNKDHSEIRA